MRQETALFFSVKPRFAEKIMHGFKTIELRRVRPCAVSVDTALIYSSSPEMALLGSARVKEIISEAPHKLWRRVRKEAGLSRREYDNYFLGAKTAVGIRFGSVQPLLRPIPLQELRERWPWLHPPRSYLYVDARLSPQGDAVVSLSPSAGSR